MNSITARPAYGRDYTSKKATLEAWVAGKDFQDVATNQYFSVRDVAGADISEVRIRYNKMRNVLIINTLTGKHN